MNYVTSRVDTNFSPHIAKTVSKLAQSNSTLTTIKSKTQHKPQFPTKPSTVMDTSNIYRNPTLSNPIIILLIIHFFILLIINTIVLLIISIIILKIKIHTLNQPIHNSSRIFPNCQMKPIFRIQTSIQTIWTI